MITLQDLHKKDKQTDRVITYEKWKKKVKETTLMSWVELTEKEKMTYGNEFDCYYEKKWTHFAVEMEAQYENVDRHGVSLDLPF